MVSLIGGFNPISSFNIFKSEDVKETEGLNVESMGSAFNDVAEADLVSEHGDTFNATEQDFNTKIQYRPDYIEDLATENFNTINSLTE